MTPAIAASPAWWRRRLTRVAFVLITMAVSMGHVGSPDTFFTGPAGPYPVHVAVRLPGVIPGLAQITVRFPGVPPDRVSEVAVRAIQWNVGPEGAPPADIATRVSGDAELFASDLWFMAPTSYRVHVEVNGRDGKGVAVVPVLALATAQREMPRGMGFVLAGLGLFLALGMLTIIGAAVRESGVRPGESPDPARRRRSRIAIAIGAALLAAILLGGRLWWNAEALAYGESVVYRPFASDASVREEAAGGRRVLTLAIKDRRWPPAPGNVLTRYNVLMPDHGKLMHLFLIRDAGLDAFAHLHPKARDSASAFDVVLPPLPSGRYRVYGDIVHESGYAQTLVSQVDLGEGRASDAGSGDPDDSWFQSPAAAASATTFRTTDGAAVIWERGEDLEAGTERLLRFSVRDGSGAPAALEPYMGMIGHVAVASEDGRVFAHLHPSGSVSMAALRKFTPAVDAHAQHQPAMASEVSTLYAFPRPGRYRIWVQVKRAVGVTTAAFDATVVDRR